MTVSSEDLSIIRECSKDEAAYLRLVALFQRGDVAPPSVSEQQLMRQNRFLNVLHQLTLNLLKHKEPDRVLQSVVEVTSLVMDAPYSSLVLKEDDVLVVRAFTSNQPFVDGLRLPRGAPTVAWQVYDTCQPVMIKDYSTYDGAHPVLKDLGLHALLAVPIVIEEACVGVLAFARTVPDDLFDAEQIEEARLMARLAGVALDNTRLVADVRRELAERKQTEEALRQSGERFRVIVSQMSDTVIVLDARGKFIYVNPAYERELGYRSEDILGLNALDFVHPEDAHYLANRFELISAGEQNVNRREIRLRCADEGYLWFDVSTNALFDEHGRFSGVITVGRNATEQRQLDELRLKEEGLRINLQKEQELGELKSRMMRRISHEFRTPLSVIQTSIDILERYSERLTPEDHHMRFEKVRGEIKQLTRLLDEISLFTKGHGGALELNLSQVDLLALTQDVIARVQRETEQQRDIKLYAESLLLEADESLLRICIQHLLANAILYSPPETPIQIGLRVEQSSVVVEVTDHGIGIPEEEQQAIFEPFYRSKYLREVSGIGMGLSVARVIVAAHGGQIKVASQRGAGSTFTVRLPLYPSKV